MTRDDENEVLAVSEAAAILRVSPVTVRRLPASDLRPVMRIGRRGDRRYRRSDVEALLRKWQEGASGGSKER